MIIWIPTGDCDPPHPVSRWDEVYDLAQKFSEKGWGIGYPALVGYQLATQQHYPRIGCVQLLTGTHRLEAAKLVGLRTVPVVVRSEIQIWDAYGDLWKWAKVMKIEIVNTMEHWQSQVERGELLTRLG